MIVTILAMLDSLVCHFRAWLPRDESRSFWARPDVGFGIPRARQTQHPHPTLSRKGAREGQTRAGMTPHQLLRSDKIIVTIFCTTQ
jgi:hypothetical protein